MANDNVDVGFEEGLSWLPAHILHEACGDVNQKYEEQIGCRARQHQRRYQANCPDSLPLLTPGDGWKIAKKYYYTRPRHGCNKASGGPGMQAVFLEPTQRKTCGTGVFLPRRAGIDVRPTKKPACSPVLLPYRVVQALNLNIQALGLQISPHEDQKKSQGRIIDAEDFGDDCNVISPSHTCSPEVLLPKEWSY